MSRTAVALVTVALLGALGAAAQENEAGKKAPPPPAQEKPARGEKEKTAEEKPVVITNETLEARYGGTSSASAVSAITGPDGKPIAPAEEPQTVALPDALDQMRDEQASERDRKLMVARLDREITSMEDRIALLERRVLAVRNPFLPRPEIPEDERAAWDGMSAPERVATTQSRIDDLRRQAQALRERRDRLASGE